MARARNGAIGKDGDLPWRLSDDLKHFKATTLGKPVVMGRRTWESIGRPLPGRTNIVITRDTAYTAEGCVVVHSLDEAIRAAGEAAEVMIIGGGEIYREALPSVDRIYMTLVHARIEGDTFFPEFPPDDWQIIEQSRHTADDKNQYAHSFLVYDRASV